MPIRKSLETYPMHLVCIYIYIYIYIYLYFYHLIQSWFTTRQYDSFGNEFGLVSLFNGIWSLLGYLILNMSGVHRSMSLMCSFSFLFAHPCEGVHFTWMSKDRMTSQNLHTTAQCWYRMLPWRPTASNGW